MESKYSFYVLGGLTIKNDRDIIISLSSRKAEALLIYLIFSEKASCEREELATLFWEDMPEQQALTNLRVTLSNIKKELGDILDVSRRKVVLNPVNRMYVDGLELLKTLGTGLGLEPSREMLSLEKAQEITKSLSLYKGDFLKGFYIRNALAFEDWVAYNREGIKTSVIAASQILITTYFQNGRYSDGIEAVNQLLFIDPFNDAAYQSLIKLYAADGQRDTSISTFVKYKTLLELELGIEPDKEIVQIIEQIRKADYIPEQIKSESKKHTSLPIPNNIPVQVTSFVGRDKELEQLRGHLSNPQLRLITMIGQGGIGKTRLAIEAARHNIQKFPEGVWFVPLEGVVTPNLVLPEIFKTLKIAFPEKTQAITKLVEHLNGHRMLLVLDNFEHVLDASGLVSEVINKTKNSKFIVTSREITGLPEEVSMAIEGLSSTPQNNFHKFKDQPAGLEKISPAAMLFIDRAKRIDPNFNVGDNEIKLISDIIELVSGLPLGIELAAAGIKRYSLTELRDFISADSSFLKTDQPELPERQRSLISVFNAFWKQLSEDERIIMSRLAVFRGVVTQTSAQKVASASPFFLGSLVSRGLLQRKMPQGYVAHSMHRRFSYEKLKENMEEFESVHVKHRDYFFAYIKKLERDIRDNPQKELLDEIEFEHDNIRAAISFTIQAKDEQKAMEFCELMMPFWKIRGYYAEGYYWLNQTFELNTNADLVMKSAALCAAAKLVTALGDYDKAVEYSNRSLKLATDLGDRHGVARALNSLGASVASSGDVKRAEIYFTKSLEIYRNLRVQQAIAGTLVHIADMETQNKNLDQARTFLDEALIIFRTVGDIIGIVHVLQSYAKIHIIRNQFAEAYGQLLESMEIAWRLQARDELVNNYLLLAEYHSFKSDHENAVCLLSLVDDLTERYKISLKVDDKKDYKKIKGRLLKELKREKFDELWIKGKTISESQIISKYL